MKNLTLLKALFLAIPVFVAGLGAKATTYIANTSGNFSDSSIWSGGVVPSYYMTTADTIIINSGVVINLDQDIALNNDTAFIGLYGNLTGAQSLSIYAGEINGMGTLGAHNLTMGSASRFTFAGVMNVDNLYNSEALLQLTGTSYVADTIAYTRGIIQLNNGGALTLADSVTLMIADGSYNVITGSVYVHGVVNLLYTAGDTIGTGPEISLTNINNITVRLGSPSAQVDLMDDISASGSLSVINGNLNLNGNDITVNNTISTTATGMLMSTGGSSITVNGTGYVGSMSFVAGRDSLYALNVSIGGGGSVDLNSDLVVDHAISVDSGVLQLSTMRLTSHGPLAGAGALGVRPSSDISLIGNGNMGTLRLAGGSYGDTLGNFTLSAGSSGGVTLGSAANVSGIFSITDGNFLINGQALTISGTVVETGTGGISGDTLSDLTVASSGSVGTLMFTPGTSTVHNLSVTGGNVTLGTPLTVAGRLNLANGIISLGADDLTLTRSDSILGGSSLSYVATLGSGSLVVPVSAGLLSPDSSRTLFIGTSTDYAPIRITNQSQASGNFKGNAHPGIFASGTSGTDLSATQSSVSTSWLIQSDVTAVPNVTLQAFWSRSMQVNQFDSSRAYISHYGAQGWDSLGTSQTTVGTDGMISLTRSNITSFSPFAVFSSAAPVVAPTATTDLAAAVQFATYPNPAHNVTTVSVPDTKTNNLIRVYDMIGNQVAQYPVTQTANTIDISRLNEGVYFVSVGDKYTQKLIKR